jgi:hypothetical protein
MTLNQRNYKKDLSYYGNATVLFLTKDRDLHTNSYFSHAKEI